MVRRNKNVLIIALLIAVIVLVGGWMVLKKGNKPEEYDNNKAVNGGVGDNNDDTIQYVASDEDMNALLHHSFDVVEAGDDPQFIDGPDPDTGLTAGQLSLGTGPGLYGSGRHTSELYGN